MRKIWKNVYRWGDPEKEEHSVAQHVAYFKERLQSEMAPESLTANAHQEVVLRRKCRLSRSQLKELVRIVGSENVQIDDFSRARHTFGKFYAELLRLRAAKDLLPPDAVIYPRSEDDVVALLRFCRRQLLAVIPWGGGTSVTRALEATRGGIAVDLTR
ncbi:MAG: FAD-dependent oxidoreductase, partial [Turneriella sp.]|nr:FAD-dependent oxidoreductase [Turneriella sp.]